ncbi:hypothetical protein [Paenibacillus ottowii]
MDTIKDMYLFPDLESRGLELYAIGGELRGVSLQINDLVSIWGNDTVQTLVIVIIQIEIISRQNSLSSALIQRSGYTVSELGPQN